MAIVRKSIRTLISLCVLGLGASCSEGTAVASDRWPYDESESESAGGRDAGDPANAPSDEEEVDETVEDGGALSVPDPVAKADAGLVEAEADAAPAAPSEPETGDAVASVLHTEGNQILDTCGEPFVPRGMEQLTGSPFSADGTLEGIVREIAQTGANAVRILPLIDEVTPAALDSMLSAFAAQKIVVYISPGDRNWFARSDVREVLLRHEKGLILDAFQEPNYWDVNRWVGDVKGAIASVRAQGYTCPITVLADGYGRNLPAALEHGRELVDTDPEGNTIVGWQAYWGQKGFYQGQYMMTLAQGVERVAGVDFPMQIGIDAFADPDEPMDYEGMMDAAETHGVGWLWWDWWNQFGSTNSASVDGTYANLSAFGRKVVETHPHSIKNTAKKACFR